MNNNDGLDALRRANPRAQTGFAEAVDAARRAGLTEHAVSEREATWPVRPRRRLIAVSVVGAGVAAAVGVTALLLGGVETVPGHGTTTGGGGAVAAQDPAASLRLAAAVTSSAADDSGKAVVRMTRNGQPWAGNTVTWNGDNISIVEDSASHHPNYQTRVVDGVLYARDAVPNQTGWFKLGSPDNIDPDSGTTPLEILAAVREDSAGQTLTRITGSMTDLTTTTGPDGSITYSGKAPAGVVAQEQDFKDGKTIRVLPYGSVAQDAASDPATPIAVTIVAGPDHLVRSITAQWGGGSAWTYTVTFNELGTGPEIVVPENARPLVLSQGRRAASRSIR